MPLYTFIHNLLTALVQIANKMGLQKKSVTKPTQEQNQQNNIIGA
jgi:hypothetical protein